MAGIEKLPWKRLTVEAAAIVGSILLAFAIDAWWEERQTRYEEQQILQGLNAEFIFIHEVLTGRLAQHLQRLQILEKVLLTIQNGPSNDAGLIVEAAVLEMVSPTTSDLGNGTLDALLSSGRIEILMNKTLRARLAAWNGVIREVWDDQEAHAKMVYEIFVPYFVSEHAPVGAAMRLWYDDWSLPLKTIPESPDVIRRLLEDPRFFVLAQVRYGYKRHLTAEFEAAIVATEAILVEIEKSIWSCPGLVDS